MSLFIDPAPEQVETARELAADIVELHTGALANAFTGKIAQQEMERLRVAAIRAQSLGLQVNAGHGINYRNIQSNPPTAASHGVEHWPLDCFERDLCRIRKRP